MLSKIQLWRQQQHMSNELRTTRFVAGVVSIDLGESFYVLNEDGTIKEFDSHKEAEAAARQMENESTFSALIFVDWE